MKPPCLVVRPRKGAVKEEENALKFDTSDGKRHDEPTMLSTQHAYFGGGCFWCTEAAFESLRGVVSVMPGYAGGHKNAPTYGEVCTGETGHAEVIRIEFDPTQISYEDLLAVFFASHDSTSLNKQGYDVGTQYRSIILYTDEAQQKTAEAFIASLNQGSGAKTVTEVVPLITFFPAEAIHHHYFQTHPEAAYCQFVINPKFEAVKHRFSKFFAEKEKKTSE